MAALKFKNSWIFHCIKERPLITDIVHRLESSNNFWRKVEMMYVQYRSRNSSICIYFLVYNIWLIIYYIVCFFSKNEIALLFWWKIWTYNIDFPKYYIYVLKQRKFYENLYKFSQMARLAATKQPKLIKFRMLQMYNILENQCICGRSLVISFTKKGGWFRFQKIHV